MRTWHHKRETDLPLRLAGAALCGLAYLALRTLAHMRMPPWPASPGLVTYALAAAGFVCASAGSALLTLGHHIFDEIEVSSRWMPNTALEQDYRAATRDRGSATTLIDKPRSADDEVRDDRLIMVSPTVWMPVRRPGESGADRK